ncbi:diacylglycerol o-acyltransferase 1 [Chrysochromulina tobinii]|uniref:Acyltransferase n=1 Tax=Chrysochromulina tobinii TaxID=1460289 RepID=A0A0M0K5M1_9EUKA|nr:diacylglycerol o-acyltransferase 1 [Chrysochromulina tobinii]|eukprot:KOO33897.1 diacylglycerol o-acyltransferase 1 [Chrysochromulina sp. CCMP291]
MSREEHVPDVLPPKSIAAELFLIFFCIFYLGTNFVIFYIPFWLYFAYQGSLVCRALIALTLVDYCVPLRTGDKGLWVWWCKLTSFAKGFRSYFDADLVVEGKWRQDRNYLLMYHPHSLFGIAYTLITRYIYEVQLPGCMFLFTGADVIQYLPLLRRIMAWWGCTSVSAKAMKKHLGLKFPFNALMLQVGGIAEMFYGLDQEQIILKKRLGFCKLALQTGCCLVPCYVFGANEMYTRLFGPDSLLAGISSRIQMSLVVWYGRWGIPFGVVPHQVKMVIVLGEPIEVTKVDEPTPEQVQELHAKECGERRAVGMKVRTDVAVVYVARGNASVVPTLNAIQQRTAALGGKQHTYTVPKLFLHELLPAEVSIAIILDADIVALTDLMQLVDEVEAVAEREPDAALFYAPEQQNLYRKLGPWWNGLLNVLQCQLPADAAARDRREGAVMGAV